MFAEFGYGILVVSFLIAIYGVVVAIYGAQNKSATLVESARRAMLLTFPLITLSAVTLIYLLVNDHYEVAFVYEVTSRSMPTYLKITSWWGAHRARRRAVRRAGDLSGRLYAGDRLQAR